MKAILTESSDKVPSLSYEVDTQAFLEENGSNNNSPVRSIFKVEDEAADESLCNPEYLGIGAKTKQVTRDT
jgi:hypothetical protein